MKPNYVFLMDKLKGEYLTAFKQVELYATVEPIDGDTQNEMLMELLDILLVAQEKGKPAEKIVGSDMEAFCKSFFSENRAGGWLKLFLDAFYRVSWFMLVVQLLEVLFSDPGGGNPLLLRTDISGYITGFCGAFVFSTFLSYLFRPLLFRWRRLTTGIYCAVSLIGSIGVCFGLLTLLGEGSLMIPNWVALLVPGLYILCVIGFRANRNYRRYGSLRRKKEPGEQTFWGTVTEQSKKELPMELNKRYRKINRRRAKRGKELLTPQEFTEKIRKEVKLSKRITGPIVGVLALFILALIIETIFTDGFLEGLAFAGLMVVMEIPAMFIFWASNLGDKEKQSLLEACDRRGITLPELAAELEAGKSE